MNRSKVKDARFWNKWKKSGAIGNIHGRDYAEAYAFFNCEESLDKIAEEIPYIRELAQTPKRLGLCFAERALPFMNDGTGLRGVDSELLEIANEANEAGIRYVALARAPSNVTNAETADELSAILNQMYQSPLYQEGEPFRGEIVYKDKDRYVFRE